MTDKLKSQVSAFVDDELLEAESELLIRRLCSDTELRRTAARYTLIGDAIRGSLHEIRADLAGNIMQVIENEPLATPEPAARTAKWPKALGGGLLAATVAAVAVFSLRPAPGPTTPPATADVDVGEESIVVPPINDQVEPFQRAMAPAISPAGNQTQLDRYLLRHHQYATATGRQGVLTYRSMGVEGESDAVEGGGADGAPRNREEAGESIQ